MGISHHVDALVVERILHKSQQVTAGKKRTEEIHSTKVFICLNSIWARKCKFVHQYNNYSVLMGHANFESGN